MKTTNYDLYIKLNGPVVEEVKYFDDENALYGTYPMHVQRDIISNLIELKGYPREDIEKKIKYMKNEVDYWEEEIYRLEEQLDDKDEEEITIEMLENLHLGMPAKIIIYNSTKTFVKDIIKNATYIQWDVSSEEEEIKYKHLTFLSASKIEAFPKKEKEYIIRIDGEIVRHYIDGVEIIN